MLLDLVMAELPGLDRDCCLIKCQCQECGHKGHILSHDVTHLVRLELGRDQTLEALEPGLERGGGPPAPPGPPPSPATTSPFSLSNTNRRLSI